MATAKKGRKSNSPKKGSKGNKKNGKSTFFKNFMLILLVLLLVILAIFLISKDFTINTNDSEIPVSETKAVTSTKSETKTETKVHTEKPKTIGNNQNQVKTNKQDVASEKDATPKKESKTKKNLNEIKTLNGFWLSSEQGASITIDDFGYRIDFFGVDASQPITGEYHFENNLIVFTSDGNVCDNIEGYYRITFHKNNFSLICKDDECSKRRNILEADWEWVEI